MINCTCVATSDGTEFNGFDCVCMLGMVQK